MLFHVVVPLHGVVGICAVSCGCVTTRCCRNLYRFMWCHYTVLYESVLFHVVVSLHGVVGICTVSCGCATTRCCRNLYRFMWLCHYMVL